jgi:hypothetical protein
MNIDTMRSLKPVHPKLLAARKGTERTRLIVAGSADQLSYWKDWREGNFDFALLGSWPHESLTMPNES